MSFRAKWGATARREAWNLGLGGAPIVAGSANVITALLVSVAVAFACVALAAPAFADLLLRGDFEGTSGSAAFAGGDASSDAHSGAASRACDPDRRIVFAPVHLPSMGEVRVSAWAKSAGGSPEMTVRLLAGRDEVAQIAVRWSATAGAATDWRYTAAQIDLDKLQPRPDAIQIICASANGPCLFDDILIVGPWNIAPNPTFAETKPPQEDMPAEFVRGWAQQAAGWRREYVLPGQSAVSTGGGHEFSALGEGVRALRLTADGGTCAVSAPQEVIDASFRDFAIGATTRGSASGTVALYWYGRHGFISASRCDVKPSADWSKSLAGPFAPPAGAERYQVVCLASGAGALEFTRIELLGTHTAHKPPHVLVNQVGYPSAGAKTLLVQTTEPPQGAFEITTAQTGKALFRGALVPAGRMHEGRADDWGFYYAEGRFDALRDSGRYVATVNVNGETASSHPFGISPAETVAVTAEPGLRFFWLQRCGMGIPNWHEPCHLDDAVLPDGRQVDVHGGWHDAGDYNKYLGTTPHACYSIALAADLAPDLWVRPKPGVDNPDALGEVLWGLEYMRRLQDPQTGALMGTVSSGYDFWGPPSQETDNIPNTGDERPLSGGASNDSLLIAAFAIAARRTGDSTWLDSARRLWDYSLKHGWSGGDSEVLAAALEMYAATNDIQYADEARRRAPAAVAQLEARTAAESSGFAPWGRACIDQMALARFAVSPLGEDLRDRIGAALEAYFRMACARARNPFSLLPISYGPGGDTFFTYNACGTNDTPLTNAGALCMAARAFPERFGRWPLREPFARLLADQIDWVLGKNPLDLCMMAGVGTRNLPRQHHRYVYLPNCPNGVVPGGIPNGFTRVGESLDRPYVDLRDTDAMSTEVWIPHSAAFLVWVAAMHALQQ